MRLKQMWKFGCCVLVLLSFPAWSFDHTGSSTIHSLILGHNGNGNGGEGNNGGNGPGNGEGNGGEGPGDGDGNGAPDGADDCPGARLHSMPIGVAYDVFATPSLILAHNGSGNGGEGNNGGNGPGNGEGNGGEGPGDGDGNGSPDGAGDCPGDSA